ncbi:MAG: type II toxin-antitoxin system HicB family antitoxin [Calditrichaeota bacterium]|nr:type II toxin-antitoxin system HicB family antitoxin [Calditrichota bacterium]
MRKIKFIFWKEQNEWLGYLEEFPDYWTEGKTLEELKDNLRDLYKDLAGGAIPSVRKVDELEVA